MPGAVMTPGRRSVSSGHHEDKKAPLRRGGTMGRRMSRRGGRSGFCSNSFISLPPMYLILTKRRGKGSLFEHDVRDICCSWGFVSHAYAG
jgi:hypothetical protein